MKQPEAILDRGAHALRPALEGVLAMVGEMRAAVGEVLDEVLTTTYLKTVVTKGVTWVRNATAAVTEMPHDGNAAEKLERQYEAVMTRVAQRIADLF